MLGHVRGRLPLAGSVVLLVAGWLVGRALFEIDVRFSDVPLYREYGERLLDGEVPYRDVPVEYPPAALPLFALPAAVSSDLDGFRLAFELLLLLCAAGTLAAVDVALCTLGASPMRRALALGFVAVAPLLLGRVSWERYDLWPALLATAGVAALLVGRHRLSAVALGLGAAAKLFPLVLVPLLALRAGRREALAATGLAIGVLAACLAPFLALAPGETVDVFERQVRRPLQIESLGASALLVAREVGGLSLGVESSYGSINLGGQRAAVVSALLTLAAAALLAFVVYRAWRDRPAHEGLVMSAAALVAVVVVLGKVLSPQFLLWLVPLVALLGGRRGALGGALLGAALVVTHLVFPDRYLALIRLDAEPVWLLALRNVLLVALLAVVLDGLRYERQPPVSPL
jgi:hypothetical protein